MKENYDTFFDELIKHEGGFTDDERDPGNQRFNSISVFNGMTNNKS